MFRDNDHKNGFTLLEVLVVLMIWSLLVLLVAPIHFTYIEKQRERSFFETFAFDVLYTQNLSTTTKDYVQLNIYEDRYIIRKGYRGEIVLTRNFPADWVINTRTLHTISFNDKGRIRTPGNFVIQTKNHKYTIIFPFGKGRYRVVEQ